MSNITKNFVHHAPYLRNHTSYDNISTFFFFHFFKTLIFWVVSWVNGQKPVQTTKHFFCLLHSISQEPYLIWLSFVVNMCNLIICQGVFFIFLKIWFSGSRGQKSAQNDETFCQSPSISQKPYIIIIYGANIIVIYGANV